MLNLSFKTVTKQKVLIILHGLFGSSDNWQNLAKQFSKEFLVFALDLRNHGESPHSDVMNYHLMSEDVLHFMDQHQLHEANFIGHSMGGKVAMQFASEHSDRVAKLIVADIAPKAYPASHSALMKAMLAVDFSTMETRRDIDQFLAQSIPNKGIRQFLLKNLKRNADRFKWQINLEAIEHNYPFLLREPNLEKPFLKATLFIKGEKSDYIQENDKELIQHHFPNQQLKVIPNSGHWLHAEYPDQFYSLSMDFLK